MPFICGKLFLFFWFYLSVFVHESAHIVASLLLGVDVKELYLGPMGVSAKYLGRTGKVKDLLISLAGPLLSFFLVIYAKNEMIKVINGIILIFNLSPIYPLDGGRILKSMLSICLGDKIGTKLIQMISMIALMGYSILSIFMAIYERQYYYLLLCVFMISIYQQEMKKEKLLAIINYLQTKE